MSSNEEQRVVVQNQRPMQQGWCEWLAANYIIVIIVLIAIAIGIWYWWSRKNGGSDDTGMFGSKDAGSDINITRSRTGTYY